MSKTIRPSALAAVALAAAAMPATASARFIVDPPASATAADGGAAGVVTLAPQHVTAAQGFQWDDAGIGAGAVLVVLGAAGVATIGRRRRTSAARTDARTVAA